MTFHSSCARSTSAHRLALHARDQVHHAQEHISRALTLRHPNQQRNRTFDLIGLARTYLIVDEPEHVCELITEVLPLAQRWARGRVGVKLASAKSSPITPLTSNT